MSFLLASCLATTVVAQPLKTETEVVHLFLQSNLGLIAGESQIDFARAQKMMEEQFANPDISFNVAGLGNASGYAGDYWKQPYDNLFRIEQRIETAGKRQLRIDRAALGLQVQDLLFKDLLRSLTRDVRQAFYQVVLQQHKVAIYDEMLVHLSEIQQANELRWRSGDISETEFRRSELEALKARTDVEQAHLDLDTARQQLAERLSHGTDWQLLVLQDHFPHYTLTALTQSQWLEKALAERADLAATVVQIEQNQKQVSLAEAKKTPDVIAGVQYQHNTTSAVPDSLGLGVSVSVPLWHNYQGEIDAAKVQKRQSDIAWQQLSVQIKTQVSIALSQFKQKQNALERFDKQMLSAAKQVREASGLAYRQGAISLLELLDAEKNYRNIMLDYDQALYDQTTAWLDLMYAIGEEGGQEYASK